LTHREEDKRVRRGKDAAKGATVIFWRLAGGAVDALLALRVLLLDFVAIIAIGVVVLVGFFFVYLVYYREKVDISLGILIKLAKVKSKPVR
jgi:signal transduction histidine kinase